MLGPVFGLLATMFACIVGAMCAALEFARPARLLDRSGRGQWPNHPRTPAFW